jgi:DNA recombination protein RmuC
MQVMMNEAIAWIILFLSFSSAVLLILVLLRFQRGDKPHELREEFRALREEASRTARDSREELSKISKEANETLVNTLTNMTTAQREQLESMTDQVQKLSQSNYHSFSQLREEVHGRIQALQASQSQNMDQLRRTLDEKMLASHEQLSQGLKAANDTLAATLSSIGEFQTTQLETVTTQCTDIRVSNESALERIRASVDAQGKALQQTGETNLGEIRTTLDLKLEQNRQELADGLTAASERLSINLNDIWQVQRIQLEDMKAQLMESSKLNESSLDRIRSTLDLRVKELQDTNEKKLEDMRKTVDEKLHETLENRLQASFATVSERLEAVQRGLGEMQNLAMDVGDLQRVLTNVKVRGTWAEIQLGSLLDQILAPGQYERNVRLKADSSEAVEYAVRLPGTRGEPNSHLWLPIDSKFPQEDYRRVQEAADRANAEEIKKAVDDLARTIRVEAHKICERYINPPTTTDFAIMFLATEGLYGEVIRQSSLVEELQRRFRVVVAGPTTLIAILNSLRMGFQTLAIEQRASEVAKVLGAVKTEFGKFNVVLEKVKLQLNTATRTIEESGFRRTRAIERTLRSVERLPELEAATVLQISDNDVALELDELDESEVLLSPQAE